MQIDLDHLHYWMCAIRQSTDPLRTLDAFWKGQIDSKLWLIDNLKPFVTHPVDIDIHGGWVGVLSSMIFQSSLPVMNIRSIDLDQDCQQIATVMNTTEYHAGRFQAITSDMCYIDSLADVIINTSCEHISQEQYDYWLSTKPKTSLLVLQSNNYNIPEHIRIANSLADFKDQSNCDVLWEGELVLPLYTRYMIIGYRNV
jgi:hypothetical protein